MKKYMIAALGMAMSLTAVSQSVLDRTHLENVRTQLDRPMYAKACSRLMADADLLLDVEPLSVMSKRLPAPSGDNHDYTSLARYFHPDPSKSDGLPYVNRDGITNPEIALYDRENLGTTADRVTTLALAWFFSGDKRYADKAARLLKTWFLDPATRMNPNFEYAQMVPGVNGNKGRSYGVLDGYSFISMLDAVSLLRDSGAWSASDDRRLKKWMSEMLRWMLTSPQGQEEAAAANNHSIAFDAQAIAMALYVGDVKTAREILDRVPERRIFAQIAPDGTQPHEMGRTLSYHYSQYNLSHLIDIFLMARKAGIGIDGASSADGRSFYKAMDLLAAYLGKDAAEWPGQQLHGWEQTQRKVAEDLWRVAAFVDTTRRDYRQLYQKHRVFDPSSRFTLLYYTPDEFDDAFTLAADQLNFAIARTTDDKKLERNAAKRKVSPRTVDPDGSLALVHPHDWTSGFFPGELWQMYEFTNDLYWRRQAISFTWPIEEAKWHRGTHDLGFMIGDSFGKAWKQTGERSYLDVVRQAAETLTTRFNPTTGVIRSWDHNPEEWKYPVIIDNMMNLEMLFWTSRHTGDRTYYDIAVRHADRTLENHFREDNSSYHVVSYNGDGTVETKGTFQGYSDESTWARGQAWGLYGYAMCYRETGCERYLEQAEKIAELIMNHPATPEDRIPYWDYDAPNIPNAPRDSSAAAVMASALFELSTMVDGELSKRYFDYGELLLMNLSTASYLAEKGENGGFILKHAVGHLPANSEIDVPLNYGDYYYLEAIRRYLGLRGVDPLALRSETTIKR